MDDVIIFMSTYNSTGYKSHLLPKKKQELAKSLQTHHITFMLVGDKLISSKGYMILETEYDYIQQKTLFSFNPIDNKQSIEDFENVIDHTGFCVKLLHAQTVLSDSLYFNIDFFINMESFLVYINENVFQIDPVIYSMNNVLIIAFEVIDFKTKTNLKKEDILGIMGNYNLLTVHQYQYFGEEQKVQYNGKISQIIYDNVNNLISELSGKKFEVREYSFVHSTLVLSNDIDDVSQYFCDLIKIKQLPSPLVNISTTDNYEYYLQDGASVIRNYNANDIDVALYNGIIFESIKLYVYMMQIINNDTTSDLNEVIRNNLYLENLFFAPNVAIETNNLLNYIYKTKSFQNRKEAIRLKISYMKAENDVKKNRNSVLLNILLYIVSLLGTIDALDILESKLKIPFTLSFTIVIIAFSVFGLIWVISEYRQNKRF